METLSLDMNKTSFPEFNERFYERFPDLSVFNCGEINLVKVVLDGLKVNYIEKGPYNPIQLKIGRIIKQIKTKQPNLETFSQADFLVYDTGRAIKDKMQLKSLYFSHILTFLAKNNVSCFVLQQTGELLPTTNISIQQLYGLRFKKLDSIERNIRKQIRIFSKRMKLHVNQHDKQNIDAALDLFFSQYLIWRVVLEHVKPAKILFNRHYHNEGLIFAAKQAKIRIEELQHGIISKADIFYLFPQNILPVRKGALFPDKIYVYGKYWKSILQLGFEFDSEHIDIIGFYQTEAENHIDKEITKLRNDFSQIFLVTSQTFMSSYFIKYIESVYEQLSDIDGVIIVKLHPQEKIEDYEGLNLFERIKVFKDKPLSSLFKIADAHISIYSTTLFDAIRHGVLYNFAIVTEDFHEYTTEIIETGIAQPIQMGSLPLYGEKNDIEATAFYDKAQFNKLID